MDVPEHTLMILDWMNTTAEERFPGLTRREPGQMPITFLLDGRGRPKVLFEKAIELLATNLYFSKELDKKLGHVESNDRIICD